MLVGYARVSTQDQDPALQLDALKGAGCEKVFTEKASGAQRERPQLRAALDYMRAGDTLLVWKLDRLARSLKQLIETVEDLGDRGIGLRSLTESIDTGSTGGRLVTCTTASAVSTCNPTWTSSPFDSIAAVPDTPPSTACSPSASRSNPPPTKR